MRNYLLFLLFSLVFHPVASAQDTTIVKTYSIGQIMVAVYTECFKTCNAKIVFINLHHNEYTSVDAAENYLCESGGRLVYIENCDERFISFVYRGVTYLFDPNRIFSSAGIETTMQLLSCYDPTAAAEIANFANHLLRDYIDNTKLIIALHNNKDKELSIKSYQKDQALKKHFGKVFINPKMDEDDFILTTNLAIFNQLKDKNINAVLENAKAIPDDGSLSAYAGRNNIAYINVEAQHEHADEQVVMISALKEIIKKYSKAPAPHREKFQLTPGKIN